MMNSILLISEDYLKTNSNLNDNAFGKWILPAIRESQEMGLMPILGECLYNKICALVGNGLIEDEMYVAYKDLLDERIQPYLLYQTLTNIIPIINGKMANIGTVATNDEHIITLSQGELDLTQNYYRERADFYAKRLQDWVKANGEAFPELECGCGTMQPNLDRANNSVGMWLGGRRGKKISDGGCGCGGQAVGDGNYSDGYSDGYTAGLAKGAENQKELIEELTITANGEYTSPNGYSPIVVEIDTTPAWNSGYTSGYTDGWDNGFVSGETEGYESGYTSGSTEGFNDGYESGYTSGYSSGYTDGYDSGSTDGYLGGLEDGKAEQKALLSSTAFTSNDTYTIENGWSAVTVNVPQSGSSAALQRKTVSMESQRQTFKPDTGYDGLSSITVSASAVCADYYNQGIAFMTDVVFTSAEAITATTNGTYTPDTGNNVFFKNVVVEVPQTGGSCNLQSKSVSVSDTSQTFNPDTGYDGMSAISVSSSALCQTYYNNGHNNGYADGYVDGYDDGGDGSLDGVTFITPNSSITIDSYGVYAFVYDSGVTIPSMSILFNNSGSTGTTGKGTVECLVYGLKLDEGDYLWNPDADASNVSVRVGNNIWTGGPMVSARTIAASVTFTFHDGILPYGFFSGITTYNYASCKNLQLSSYAFTSSEFIKIILRGGILLKEHSIEGNQSLTEIQFKTFGSYGFNAESGCIVNNQSLATIETTIIIPNITNIFNGSADNGILGYAEGTSGNLSTTWWSYLSGKGWTSVLI